MPSKALPMAPAAFEQWCRARAFAPSTCDYLSTIRGSEAVRRVTSHANNVISPSSCHRTSDFHESHLGVLIVKWNHFLSQCIAPTTCFVHVFSPLSVEIDLLEALHFRILTRDGLPLLLLAAARSASHPAGLAIVLAARPTFARW